MPWHLIATFFGAAFLTNAVPHFIHGVSGQPFQSPFARPPGKGLSSATVNVAWAFVNLFVGYLLLWHVGVFDLRSSADAIAAGLGALVMSLVCARLFGSTNGGNL